MIYKWGNFMKSNSCTEQQPLPNKNWTPCQCGNYSKYDESLKGTGLTNIQTEYKYATNCVCMTTDGYWHNYYYAY